MFFFFHIYHSKFLLTKYFAQAQETNEKNADDKTTDDNRIDASGSDTENIAPSDKGTEQIESNLIVGSVLEEAVETVHDASIHDTVHQEFVETDKQSDPVPDNTVVEAIIPVAVESPNKPIEKKAEVTVTPKKVKVPALSKGLFDDSDDDDEDEQDELFSFKKEKTVAE